MFKKNFFENDYVNHVRLARCQNVGPKTFWSLMESFGSASDAIANLPELAKKGGGKISIVPESEVIKEIEKAAKFGAEIITTDSQLYPDYLKAISDAPPVLTIKGNKELLTNNKKIGVVGSRNASTNGSYFCDNFVSQIAELGYVVVSGLALGIDAVAHTAAFKQNKGSIGVIGCGIDVIYPMQNKKLFDRMYVDGLVISEFPFGAQAISRHFPQRNRIISGLSVAIAVIEASIKSGTLITARFAMEQGREIFAVPWSPLDLRSKGTNSLIKNGAHLLESIDDFISVIQGCSGFCEPNNDSYSHNKPKIDVSEKEMDDFRKKVISMLSFSPVSLELIQELTGYEYTIAKPL